jgi:general secretion pathway protein G
MQHPISEQRISRAASQRGMTLIEIMVVVAIISLILGGVGVMAFNRLQDARLSQARKDVAEVEAAIQMYRAQKRNKCPKSMQDLKAAGFVNKVAKDPWGNEYEFKCPGEKLPASTDVISSGPDGQLGTEDDIANFDEETEVPDAEK